MKKNPIIPFCVVLLFFSNLLYSAPTPLFGNNEPSHILVNNRVLARVNSKSISVYDVMKKMDMLFYKQFPQYTSSLSMRFQFYQVNWKKVLQDIIDKDLVLADADQNKFPLSNGDVRQELEMLFGPNIIINLDKAGLTFEEATRMVKEDIILRRMLFIRANAKAMRSIAPQDIRKAYESFAKENQRDEAWEYQVLTIRSADAEKGSVAAKFASDYLKENHTIDELKKAMEDSFGTTSKLTVTELLRHEEKKLSPAYKQALSTMSLNTYSDPIEQKSRSDNSTVYRIFFLKNIIPAGAPPLAEVETMLKDSLVDEAIEKETDAYIQRLRRYYNVDESHLDEMMANGFEPFVLK